MGFDTIFRYSVSETRGGAVAMLAASSFVAEVVLVIGVGSTGSKNVPRRAFSKLQKALNLALLPCSFLLAAARLAHVVFARRDVTLRPQEPLEHRPGYTCSSSALLAPNTLLTDHHTSRGRPIASFKSCSAEWPRRVRRSVSCERRSRSAFLRRPCTGSAPLCSAR